MQRFLALEASAGIILLAAAVMSFVWANSPWRPTYLALLHTPFGPRIAGIDLQRDVHFWVNDGLMVLFFFVVGLELKRELHAGALSDARRAALPAIAAVGGMIVPAVIYALFNVGTPAARGWGIPMATDIAFAVGVLTLLGTRVPPALRVLLLALAVIDDLGSIIVIALFYSSGISIAGVAVAAAGVAAVLVMQRLRFRSPWAYVVPGLVIWAGTYRSGVHPTIAGVIIGICTPIGEDDGPGPLERIQSALHGWVSYLVMPVFALANAGVSVGGARLSDGGGSVLLGVLLGLVAGKPIGVLAASWLAVRTRVAALPPGVHWSGVAIVGLVAGIGFTMALFVATLAFPDGTLIETAKLGILLASVTAGIVGLTAGRLLPRSAPEREARDPPA